MDELPRPIVLLVDDDEEDRMLMRLALQSLGWPSPVEELESGEALLGYLDKAGHFSPNDPAPWIIILDKFMPGINGFETLQRLKAHAYWRRIPVVLFVNTQDNHEMRLCVELGAVACLSKPPQFDEMVALMRSIHQHWLDYTAGSE